MEIEPESEAWEVRVRLKQDAQQPVSLWTFRRRPVGINTGERRKKANEEQELVLNSVFDDPRELVFKAWADPKCVAQWWRPRGFTNPVCELDVRPGGAIRIHMRGPDGTVYPMTGVSGGCQARADRLHRRPAGCWRQRPV